MQNTTETESHQIPNWLKANLKKIIFWVICIALIAEVLARIVFVLAKPEASYHREFDRRLAMVDRATEEVDPKGNTIHNTLFLMGDSKMMVSGYAEMLAAQLQDQNIPITVRNTAVSNGSPHMSLFMLKRALKSGYQPKLIIYSIKDLLVTPEEAPNILKESAEERLEKSYIGRCFYKPPTSLYGKAVCELEKHSYLARGRKHFKDYLGLIDTALFQPKKYQQIKFELNTPDLEISPMGWAPGYYVVPDYLREKTFKPSENNLLSKTKTQARQIWADKDWIEFLDFTQSQNIAVLFVWVPEYQTVKLNQNKLVQTRYQIISKQYQDYQNQYSNTYFINLLKTDQNSGHYYNRHHLNVLGAKQFSEKLLKIITDKPYKKYLMSNNEKKAQ